AQCMIPSQKEILTTILAFELVQPKRVADSVEIVVEWASFESDIINGMLEEYPDVKIKVWGSFPGTNCNPGSAHPHHRAELPVDSALCRTLTPPFNIPPLNTRETSKENSQSDALDKNLQPSGCCPRKIGQDAVGGAPKRDSGESNEIYLHPFGFRDDLPTAKLLAEGSRVSILTRTGSEGVAGRVVQAAVWVHLFQAFNLMGSKAHLTHQTNYDLVLGLFEGGAEPLGNYSTFPCKI
ncbi:hypothetical protein B0H11DRAFT_1937528, partial [Mycena galericulata]